MKKFFAFLHSDEGLKLAGLIVTVAYLVEEVFAEPGTPLALWAGKVLKAGILLGITSSAGRTRKEPEPPVVPPEQRN